MQFVVGLFQEVGHFCSFPIFISFGCLILWVILWQEALIIASLFSVMNIFFNSVVSQQFLHTVINIKYIHVYIYIYMYIYIERDRDSERENMQKMYLFINDYKSTFLF